MCGAMMVIPFLNSIAKTLQNEIPVAQLVWSRYLGHLLFVLLLFLPNAGVNLLRTSQPGLQLVRSILLLTSTICYFTALKYISLPAAVAISYTSPIISVALASPLLGERVGRTRWLIIVLGFVGVIIVLRPGPNGAHWAGLLVVVSAGCYAIYQILTRKVSVHDSPETSIVYTAVVGAIVLTPIMLFGFDDLVVPSNAFNWTLFIAIGIVAGIGHYLIVLAHKYAPISVIAPLNYTQLIGATILSVYFFDQVPAPTTWIGTAMIVVASALVMFDSSRNDGR